MGFLDKLLGRNKETAEGVGESAKDTGEKTMAADPGNPTTDPLDRD